MTATNLNTNFSVLANGGTANRDEFETARTRAIELTWTVVSLLSTPITSNDLALVMSLIEIPESETLDVVDFHTKDGIVLLPSHRTRAYQCAEPALAAQVTELETELNKRVTAVLHYHHKERTVKGLLGLRKALTLAVLQRIARAKQF